MQPRARRQVVAPLPQRSSRHKFGSNHLGWNMRGPTSAATKFTQETCISTINLDVRAALSLLNHHLKLLAHFK